MSQLTRLQQALRATIALEAKIQEQLRTLDKLRLALARKIVFEKAGTTHVTIYDTERGVRQVLFETDRAVVSENLPQEQESVES